MRMNSDMTLLSAVPKSIIKSTKRMADSAKVGIDGGLVGQGSLMSKSISKPQRQRPPRTLTRLIAKRSWWDIEHILSKSKGLGDMEIDEKGIITEEAVVQFALRYRAPLHIIKLLSANFPRCIYRPDSTGKYAVHVAAKYGAMPNVVDYLVAKNRTAASVQDPSGKCPIHYVGEFYASTNESPSVLALNENMLAVVRILREAAPQSFNLEDHEGYNAIEYAIESDCDIKVIKTMQRTARDDWRAMKASGHGKKHEELEKDVARTASEASVNVVLSDVIGTSIKNGNVSTRPADRSQDKPFKSFMAKSA